MSKIFYAVIFLYTLNSNAQVTINIISVPANTPANDNLYIAGSFNGWNPGSSSFKLIEINASFYTITLAPGNGTIEFKFTRGDWSRVECKADGSFQPNRTFTYGNGDTLNLTIEGWDDLVNGGGNASTALSNVTLMDDSFYIPQLDRYRKIWIYLPDDYNTALNKYYPVLYMQDGQNLFDDSTSFAGEWEIDETLHQMQMDGNYGCIVIGIENGGTQRINEYSPYINSGYGGGQGDEYCDFLVSSLKPYVDSQYRTLSSRDFTAVTGSSMGGLISFYVAMKYQHIFSKAGVFSPSFWFDDSLYTFVSNTGKLQNMRFYFVSGRNESSDMVPDIKSMYSTLSTEGFAPDEMDTVIKDDGQHAEWFWAREFPDCYLWLFANTFISTEELETNSVISVVPNPAQSRLYIHSNHPMRKVEIEIIDNRGYVLFSVHQQISRTLDIGKLKNGWYILKILDEGNAFYKKFEVIR